MRPRRVVVALAGCALVVAVAMAHAHSHPKRAVVALPTPMPSVQPVQGSLAPPSALPVTPAPMAPSPTPSMGPAAPPADVLRGADPTDATAVGGAVARAVWTSDTTADSGPTDAEIRASALFIPDLRSLLAAVNPAPPGAEWVLWSSHKVKTVATAVLQHDAGAPTDTPTVAVRSFAVTVQPVGADGWTGPSDLEVEFLTLARAAPGGPWLVARFGPYSG
jgi:hypothetical protein